MTFGNAGNPTGSTDPISAKKEELKALEKKYEDLLRLKAKTEGFIDQHEKILSQNREASGSEVFGTNRAMMTFRRILDSRTDDPRIRPAVLTMPLDAISEEIRKTGEKIENTKKELSRLLEMNAAQTDC